MLTVDSFLCRWIVFALLAAGAAWGVTISLADDIVFPSEQWEETSPQSQSLDATKLAAAVDYLKQHSGRDGVRELMIVRNGRLVWKGDDIDKVHGIWSCTKSFTSTALGLLIEDGKCTLDTPAKQFVPELAERYPDVTLRHLTTMTSGYRAVGDEPKGGYLHGPSSTPFQPFDKPLFSPPGSRFAYWDSAMNMFGLVLTRAAGEPLETLFKRRVADPIGMNAKVWDWGDYATVEGVVVNGGSGNSGKHITISAREMARLGHLFLNKGNWNGKQLISAAWIDAATSVQIPAETPLGHPESNIDGRGVYGFNWWTNGERPDGQRIWPAAPTSTFAASGHNNNKLFVIPDWNMVIVRLGLDENDGKISDAVWSEFVRLVGGARTEGDVAVDSAQATGVRFRVHEIGRPTGNGFGQTSAVDVDKDGDLDFISGRQFGDVFWFENQGAAKWSQHPIGEKARTDVGGIAFDVDGDVDVSRLDRWLENVDGKGETWIERRTFDFGKEGPWGIQTRARLVDVDRDGDLDLITKPWRGDLHLFVENLLKSPAKLNSTRNSLR